MGLFEWGIRQMDRAEANIQEFGKRFGFMPLSWRQVVMNDPSRDGLMWRIPDPAVRQASMLSSVQAILVTEYERVMVLSNGALGERILLSPGLYDLRRMETLRGSIEVIWFTTNDIQMRWGVGDILTTDRITIGASGFFGAKIVDPLQFLLNVPSAANAQVYKMPQLLDVVKPFVSDAIRNQMAHTSVMDFQTAQPAFQRACYELLAPRFAHWGLEFGGLTIAAQSIPEEWREKARGAAFVTLDKDAERAGLQADIELEQLKAQKEQIRLLLEVQRRQLLGNTSVEVMRNQLASGIDPLELQRIEAAKLLAEHPAEGALVDSRPQILSQLLPQPPATPPISPMIVAGTPFLAPPQTPNVVVSQAPSSGSGEAMSREKIQDMLDKLDERFANGEISEQVYLMLQDKWEKRLTNLS